MRARVIAGALAGAALLFGCNGSSASSPGLDQRIEAALQTQNITSPPAPPDESDAMIELGRDLFFDKILAGNRNIACATCHTPLEHTGDGLSLSIGEGGVGTGPLRQQETARIIPRNSPPLFNRVSDAMPSLFWDGRVHRDPLTGELTTPEPALNGPTPPHPEITTQLTSALAALAMFPPLTDEEMRGRPGTNDIADAPDDLTRWQLLMARLVGTNNGTVGGIEEYRQLFRAAFPTVTNFDDFNFGYVAHAIAAFVRHEYTSVDTPFDHYLAGDTSALSDAAKRGLMLYCSTARCAQCHNGPLLTDMKFHGLAVPQIGPGKLQPNEDLGRALATNDPADDYRFRTPPLRNVALTGPYMHDGAFLTLAAAVRHHLDPMASLLTYDGSQLPAPFAGTLDTDPTRNDARLAALDPILSTPIVLTDSQFSDLMAFLQSLTDPNKVDLSADFPPSVPSGLPLQD